ncbi:hypothetical protein BA190_07570 [Labrys sp. WJW]|uniref:hypothetical protein n=1 Tax=Labrys sp. WJW TaxID=1737983 RepID=UPI00082B3A31|nr:hypothetical protein [Labrys sp. WJW]OCC05615.1 hypothetical protein BA190_07570 [Labrys sp. WJW]
MSWLGGLLSAGASILGGLFGGGDDEPKVTTSYVDYRRMVREAEAAGFNPLTAIRNGGSAGFSVSSTTGGGSSPLSRVAGALPGIADNFLQAIDPFNDKSREMQYKIQEAQLANLQADTAARNRVSIGGVPAVTGGAVARPRVGSGVPHGKTNVSLPAAVPLPDSAAETKTPKVEAPTLTNPYPTQSGAVVNKGLPDAEVIEKRYGENELFSTIGGLGVFAGDVYSNIDKGARAWVDKYRKVPGLWEDAAGYLSRTKKAANKAVPGRSGDWEDPRMWYPPPLSR